MLFEELLLLLGIVAQLANNGIWAFRVIDYDNLLKEEDAWKRGLFHFIIAITFFGFSVIGFLTALSLAAAWTFWIAGFMASLSAFFSLVEVAVFFQQLNKGSQAYIPKK